LEGQYPPAGGKGASVVGAVRGGYACRWWNEKGAPDEPSVTSSKLPHTVRYKVKQFGMMGVSTKFIEN